MQISDLQYLAELAGLKLKVIVLYRDPVDAVVDLALSSLYSRR